ncbi:CHAP domain-containing protein [Rhizobium laguerreae]|uniref:cell wall hydrolase n=1 Tax=Rhizobium laguerreae TaxID=1076926 RepID=UPI001C9230F5|nr:cell wall hydrolase [Rhizobium laguerreae]MBY3328787.1 CHAP domain-containing protein [Rhizobium laguerreae]
MDEFRLALDADHPFAEFHKDPSADSPLITARPRLTGDMLVVPTGRVSEDQLWMEVLYQKNETARPLKGWIESKFVGDKHDRGPEAVPPVNTALFVAECVRYELSCLDDKTVGSDYLLAWAILESNLVNFGPQLTDKAAIGPYQLNPKDWGAYLNAPELNLNPGPTGRLSALAQIDCAAWLGKRDALAFAAKIAPEDSVGEYIPSLLNIFHVRLLGLDAAVEVQTIQSKKQANPAMDVVLSKIGLSASEIETLVADRPKFLGKAPGGGFSSVDAFVNVTAVALADAMKKAFTLLKAIPGFIPDIDNKAASKAWMDIAQAELKAWSDQNLKESSEPGLGFVRKYLDAASKDLPGNSAWCGAFVAWCLTQAGLADTVVKGPAWAANWVNWGDLDLRQRDPAGIPFGAVVVLAPADNTDSSGHVAFFTQPMPLGKIELLGGNQSNLVKSMVVERNKIVSVRWLSALDPAPDATDETPVDGGVEGATDRDVLILARTLYGEARGETAAGREAVADVVMNRVAAHTWFGSSVAGVCLKSWQFSCWNANDPNRKIIERMSEAQADETFLDCLRVARGAITGAIKGNSKGANHYHADSMKRFPSWAKRSAETTRVGHHIFYKL